MLLPIPSPAPGVVINNDTSTASVRYPVFAAITNGQAVKEYVSSSKLYYTPSTGVLNATGFAGSGTGLTGTASSLSIGGNAATATLATAATNLAGGVANNMAYQTSAGATAFITAPSISGSYLQWTSVGGFAWTAFNGVTSFSAASTGLTPNVATTGAITLGGTLSAAYGGTGANTLTGYVYGNATGAMTASSTIPNTAITGLGTMSTQNANSVAITGGAINGTAIGGSVAASGAFTYVTANQSITGTSSTGAFSYGTLSYSDVNLFASYKTNVNSYAQIVIQNTAVGTSASTDFVVSNDLGTSSSNYGDFGINSSAFVGTGSLGAAGYVYMYAQGTDLAIGTGSNNAIHLVVNGRATDAMTINGSGAVAFNGSYGTSSYLLQGGGSASAPSWINPSSLSVGSANNLLGGNSGYVPYQSAASTTAFVSAGTTGQVFTSGGTGAPTWSNQSALSVGSATNLSGGGAYYVPYQTGAGATGFLAPGTAGQVLTTNGAGSAPSWTTPSSIFTPTEVTATAGQTTFTVSYTVGLIWVLRNGVKLGSADYTASNGTSVVLASGATAGDLITFIVYKPFNIASATGTGNVVLATGPTITNPILAGATSGGVTLAVPAVAGSNTATLPAATGTVMVSGNMPAFSAYLSSAQNITSATFTKVQCNTKEYDTANAYDNSTNYRFQPLVAGYYQVSGVIIPTNGTVTQSGCTLYKNGTEYKRLTFTTVSSGSGGSALVYFNGSTDYVELYAYIVAVSPQIQAGIQFTYFQASMVRSA